MVRGRVPSRQTPTFRSLAGEAATDVPPVPAQTPQNPAWPCPWCSSVGQSTFISVCETDEATVIILCCKTETVEAQREPNKLPETTQWVSAMPRAMPGPVRSPGRACFPLFSSGLKWICSWQHKSSLALLGPCQQGGWLVPCMTSSFMSFSASPMQLLSRSQGHRLPLISAVH